jgi:hypothetical protein
MTIDVPFADLHWPDNADGVPAPLAFLQSLSAPELCDLAAAAVADLALIPHHETLAFLDKIVLARDAGTGAQLRLHRYTSLGTGDVHDHRWSFAARILTGSYEHRRFAADDVGLSVPIGSETVEAGSTYFIHWRDLHSVTALELPTWTVILRGSPQQRAFHVIGDDGAVVEKVGAVDETPEQRDQKAMTPQRRDELIAEFSDIEIHPIAA